MLFLYNIHGTTATCQVLHVKWCRCFPFWKFCTARIIQIVDSKTLQTKMNHSFKKQVTHAMFWTLVSNQPTNMFVRCGKGHHVSWVCFVQVIFYGWKSHGMKITMKKHHLGEDFWITFSKHRTRKSKVLFLSWISSLFLHPWTFYIDAQKYTGSKGQDVFPSIKNQVHHVRYHLRSPLSANVLIPEYLECDIKKVSHERLSLI